MNAFSNPFATEESWDVSTGQMLTADLDTGYGPGNHLGTVQYIDGQGNSSGSHPQVEVRVANDQGSITDWIVVIPATIGKVVQLTDALGLDRPSDEQVVQEGTGYRLDPNYLRQAMGREVGVIVRKEKNHLDPTKPDKDRVKGYVTKDKLEPSSETTPAGASNAFAAAAGPLPGMDHQPGNAQLGDDDIPF